MLLHIKGSKQSITKLAIAKRPIAAIATNATSSLGNLLLSVGTARVASTEEFGYFATTFSVYVLVVGLSNSSVIEGVLSSPVAARYSDDRSRILCTMAATSGSIVFIVGLLLGLPQLTILGLALPGLVIYDYIKSLSLGVGRVNVALAQEILWTTAVALIFFLVPEQRNAPVLIFAGWAVSGAVIGLAQARRLRVDIRPTFRMNRRDAKVSAGFALEYLTGSGVAQLITALVLIVAGAQVVGAIRAAGTVLAPCALLIGTTRGLAIPYLARCSLFEFRQFIKHAIGCAAALSIAVAAFACTILALPDWIGFELLGESWNFAKPVLPAMAGELFFAGLTAIAFALHRVKKAGFRGLAIEAGVAPIRVLLILSAAYYFGAIGASLSMLAVAILGASIWWLSFVRLAKTSSSNQDSQ